MLKLLLVVKKEKFFPKRKEKKKFIVVGGDMVKFWGSQIFKKRKKWRLVVGGWSRGKREGRERERGFDDVFSSGFFFLHLIWNNN